MNKVLIANLVYKGNVKGTQADEYVEITNQDSVLADLSGWKLNSIGNKKEFIFPNGTVLPAGKSFRVYTNEAHSEWGGFSFGSTRAIWNDKGDEAKLFDAQGNLVSNWAYNQKGNVTRVNSSQFQSDSLSDEQILEKLKELSEGLLCNGGEGDGSLEVVSWETNSITPEKLLQLTSHPPETPVEVVDVQSVDEFWHELVECNPEDERSHQLVEFIKANLDEINGYKIEPGEGDAYRYFIGKSASGNIIGLSNTQYYS